MFKLKLTRKKFYELGGLTNSSLYRSANSVGVWRYYKLVDTIT